MAKRKKMKKAGSTTRNIHKIATTLGVIPLVASSFLFTDSYALATAGTTPVPYAVRQNKTIDLGINNQLTINLSDLFESSTISNNMFTGSIVLRESNHIPASGDIYAWFTGGSLVVQGNHLGSYTVTVYATNSGTQENPYDVVEATFSVGVIDNAILKDKLDKLDGQHNGFDITDVIKAVKTNGLSADYDTNGNQVIDKVDYAQYLSFIPAGFSNHSPVLKDGTIPPLLLGKFENKVIDLNQYFEDVDSSIDYRFYTDGNILTTSYFSTTSSLILIAGENIRSAPITIVADDHKGGSKVVEFNVEVFNNHVPEINEAYPLYDLVMETGTSFHKTSTGWFKDLDVGTPYNDHLSYILGSGSYAGYATVEDYSSTNLLISAVQPTSTYITLAAVDDHRATNQISLGLNIVNSNIIGNDHVFNNLGDLFDGVSSATTFSIVGTSEDTFGAAEFTEDSETHHHRLSIANRKSGTFTVTVKAESTLSDEVGYKTFVVNTTNPINP